MTLYCELWLVAVPVADPNAPKPEGSTITPSVGEQLIVSTASMQTSNYLVLFYSCKLSILWRHCTSLTSVWTPNAMHSWTTPNPLCFSAFSYFRSLYQSYLALLRPTTFSRQSEQTSFRCSWKCNNTTSFGDNLIPRKILISTLSNIYQIFIHDSTYYCILFNMCLFQRKT